MNRPVPKLGARKTGSPSGDALKGITHLAIPVLPTGELAITEKWRNFLESEFKVNFQDEISKAGSSFSSKLGELIEIALLAQSSPLTRIFLIGVGERKPNDLRKVGTILGRKVKSTNSTLLSLCADEKDGALVHLNALALSTYLWSTKGASDKGRKIETANFLIGGDFSDVVLKSEVLVGATWRARDLIHTPSNIKSPEWIANKAKSEAKRMKLKIKVRSGRDLLEFGGLRAVGNSSKKNPPRFVEISYQPSGAARKPHVVLVGKGITFDTGGVSLKRPYDLMAPMKSDMAGAAAVLATVVAAAELKIVS